MIAIVVTSFAFMLAGAFSLFIGIDPANLYDNDPTSSGGFGLIILIAGLLMLIGGGYNQRREEAREKNARIFKQARPK